MKKSWQNFKISVKGSIREEKREGKELLVYRLTKEKALFIIKKRIIVF